MSLIMVDVEADGPIPGDYSMISLGAVRVDDTLECTFMDNYDRFQNNSCRKFSPFRVIRGRKHGNLILRRKS